MAFNCSSKSINLVIVKDESNVNMIKGQPRKIGKSLLTSKSKYNLI